MGHDPKPTRLSRNAARTAAENAPQSLLPGSLRLEGEGTEDLPRCVARAFLPFLTRDDGWLRISPTQDGKACYFKWKWTGGPHAGHYVMSVYPAHEADEALRGLAHKVHAVDSGEKPPVKDHYFHG